MKPRDPFAGDTATTRSDQRKFSHVLGLLRIGSVEVQNGHVNHPHNSARVLTLNMK